MSQIPYHRKGASQFAFSLCLMFACAQASTASSKEKSDLNSSQAVQYFDNKIAFETNHMGVKNVLEGKIKGVVIVDVRAVEDYKAGHIPKAISIPGDKHQWFQGNISDFHGLTKTGYNYIYCYSDTCNLSQKACRRFAELGYKVKEIRGGFQEWKERHYKIDTNY